MNEERREKAGAGLRPARNRRSSLLSTVVGLAATGWLLAGCPSEKKPQPESPPPAAQNTGCVVKGFYLGMPIREAVDRVNANYAEAFGPPRYKTDDEESMRWMESLPVKPSAVNEPIPGLKEYVYDTFHVVRYRDDGREYMFPFSPFMTDADGKVISIFLTGPIARKLFDAEALDPQLYLDLLARELNVPAWNKEVGENDAYWWTATVPGTCRIKVYRDKGVKVLPAP